VISELFIGFLEISQEKKLKKLSKDKEVFLQEVYIFGVTFLILILKKFYV